MKKKSTSQSAFFNVRLMLVGALCVFGVAFTLIASGHTVGFLRAGAGKQPPKSTKRWLA
jgi:hypothetical protein